MGLTLNESIRDIVRRAIDGARIVYSQQVHCTTQQLCGIY